MEPSSRSYLLELLDDDDELELLLDDELDDDDELEELDELDELDELEELDELDELDDELQKKLDMQF